MASRLLDIGHGFYNLRGSFTFAAGFIDIGTHMSLIRLSTGRFLVLDTCDFNETDHRRIKELTNDGDLIDAVVATHPFHTMYFVPFQKKFPNPQIKYYGTPRHIRRINEIAWTGDISEDVNLKLWESEGIFMRIPAGGNFINSAEDNHFSGLFVYHQPSKTLFNDDTLLYFDHPGFVLRCLGKCQGRLEFWDLKKGLNPTKEAPSEFQAFMEGVLRDWDFENLVAAHTGNIVGGAKEKIQELLKKTSPVFDKIAKSHGDAK